MKLFVTCFILILVRIGSCIEFQDCNENGEIFSVDISGCPKKSCTLIVGTKANVTVNFLTAVTAESIKENAYFIISEVEQDAEIRPDPCTAFDGPGCPLRVGDHLVYKAQLTIHADIMPVKAQLVWMLLNERDVRIACFVAPITFAYALAEDEKVHGKVAASGTDAGAIGHGGHPRQRSFRTRLA